MTRLVVKPSSLFLSLCRPIPNVGMRSIGDQQDLCLPMQDIRNRDCFYLMIILRRLDLLIEWETYNFSLLDGANSDQLKIEKYAHSTVESAVNFL